MKSLAQFCQKYKLILIPSIVKVALSLFLIHPAYDLHRDEYLYFDQGNHLAWGYAEVPPLLAFVSYCIKLLGGSVWLIKGWIALIGGLTVFYTGKIVIRLGGGAYAQLLACAGVLFSAYLRVHILYQQNSMDILLWTMISYCIVCYIQLTAISCQPSALSNHLSIIDGEQRNQQSPNKYLLYVGILIGVGILNKYNIAFFLISLLIGVGLTPLRKILLNSYFYYGIGIALLIASPNLWWQYTHHFPVTHHMAELYDSQLQYLNPFTFLVGQLIMLIPAVVIWVSGWIFLLFSKIGTPYRVFGFTYIGVITILTALHGKDYYALGIYPVLLAFGGFALEKTTQAKAWKWTLRPLLMAIPVCMGWYIFPLAIPYLAPKDMVEACKKFEPTGVLRWEDGKNHPLPQDYADMLGWSEMTEKVAKVYQSLTPYEQKNVLIKASNYGEAGAINYYGQKYGLPTTYSLNSSYALWIPDQPNILNIILIDNDTSLPGKLKYFKKTTLCDSITNPLAREQGRKIYLLNHPDSLLTAAFYKEIAERKRLFQ